MLRVSEEDKQELLVVRSQAASGPRKQGLRDAALRGRSVLVWGGCAVASHCGVVSELTTGRHSRAQADVHCSACLCLLPEANLDKSNMLNCSLCKVYEDALSSDKPVV